MSVWPDYAETGGEYAARLAPHAERAAFDDGAVRQARTATRPVLLRDVAAHLPGARFEDFRAWARDHAARWFAWADPGAGGTMHSARVVGGAHGIAYRQVSRGGAPAWEARMTLEGPPADTSIWDAPLGDDSHVYGRSAGGGEIRNAAPHRRFEFFNVRAQSGGFRLAPWMTETSPAWMVRASVREAAPGRITLRLAPVKKPNPWDAGTAAGPHLTAAARAGLALCLRAGDATVAVRPVGGEGVGADADGREPYDWHPQGAEWTAFRSAVATLGSRVRGALVWAGAGSVVDLARQTTRRGGVGGGPRAADDAAGRSAPGDRTVTAVWPGWLEISADLGARGAARVERSSDGAPGPARQAPVRPHAPGTREVVALVPEARLAAFRRWLGAHGWRWFDFPDPARGRVVRARVAGDAAWGQVARGAGAPPAWEARMTLEGPEL